MSLSRILNDDPAPAAPGTPHGAHPLSGVLDSVSMISAGKTPPFGEPSRNGSILSPTSSSISIHESTLEMNHSQWQGSPMPKSGLRLETAGEAPNISSTSTTTPAVGADNSQPPRKRRKPNNSEADSTQKRQSARKPRNSALVDADESSPARGETERTLRSSKAAHTKEGSDLEECEEIWGEDLNDYIRNTQRRFNKVEKWYNANAKERTSITAQRISHYYAQKIVSIPPPPPSPPVEQQSHERLVVNRHSYSGYEHTTERKEHFHEDNDSLQGSFAPESFDLTPHGNGKRPASVAASDTSSLDVPPRRDNGPVHKRRRLDESVDLQSSPSPSISNGISLLADTQSESRINEYTPVEDGNVKTSRKKTAYKKKAPLEQEIAAASHPSSISDVTPSVSRPASPTPTVTSVVYDLDESVPPMKKAKKMDDNTIVKRVKALEDAQKKVWTNIARREAAKGYKYQLTGWQNRQMIVERVAKLASTQARRPFLKTPKSSKDVQTKAKRLMREMQVFWKKNEKEERDVRKREHKVAMDRLKMEEEKREAARQARKLEFLISQTELYSHFVGSKLKTAEVEGDAPSSETPAGADLQDLDPSTMEEIDFDNEDKTNLYRHAKRNAQEAINQAKLRAEEFDVQVAIERNATAAVKVQNDSKESVETNIKEGGKESSLLMDLDSNELNFQNPTSLGQITIQQPTLLNAQLKEYQLKGLNWLATLYEQGINGILADEMGLGKTVQSISLLAHLAETHDIWGPFLVVAPASTLHNWQQEITRFVPRLKALPYWGNVKDRATLRKFWSRKEIRYDQDAPFHVLITSYQLVTQDQQYFQRVRWQYMVLDEAQNIKNSASARWKTLLSFHCRNRLLLTGTPIQNNMQELWALLHFIMPSLFDSHDEFNEWFSKDIESAAENKGNKLSEYQLRRLHMILKPFMLRRVKRHVQNELSEKIEKDIYVDLSARQRTLYKALLAKVSVADLLAKAANIGDADSARSLMNLVMQFRKVCNHPELFERADVVAPFSFSHFGRSGPLNREGDFLTLSNSSRNPIGFDIPELFYVDGCVPEIPSESRHQIPEKFMIWSAEWIHHSLCRDYSTFGFLRCLDMTPQEAHRLHTSPLIRRQLKAQQCIRNARDLVQSKRMMVTASDAFIGVLQGGLFDTLCDEHLDLVCIARNAWKESSLSRPDLKWFIPSAVAPAITLYTINRSFLEWLTRPQENALELLALCGIPQTLRDSEPACLSFDELLPGLSPLGLLNESPAYQIPTSPMQIPEAKRLIIDSAKLARLDVLLQELKAADHRVLIYFQMTRMMDLMEEYLIFRQYKYLRLDGSSKIEDRRDMVMDWQTRPDIFIFILSTRAGGLGINLTAADTVIFYDHDWNPSNDAQAMDRAHRLGQTRQVTVYRLITKGTIDERIVQLARVKKDVQDIVVGNKSLTDVAKPSEIVQLLLNDEQLANLGNTPALSSTHNVAPSSTNQAPVQDLWTDEGDDFLAQPRPNAITNGDDTPEEDKQMRSGPGRGKGRGKSTRGRKKRRGGGPSETLA